jgi:hypothetical protein
LDGSASYAEHSWDQATTNWPPRAFVADKSEHCDLTKGQRAMRLALLYPEPEKGGRGKKRAAGNGTETLQFSKQRLSQARAVLAYSRPLALAVRDGTKTLDEALGPLSSERVAC